MSAISEVFGRPILDSRGEWTIEVTVVLKSGARTSASVPQGKSIGKHEAKALPPEQALDMLDRRIAPAVRDMEVGNQRALDEMLIELDGSRDKSVLGGNTMLGVSYAFARASAREKDIPLWQYLFETAGIKSGMPQLYANIINGGLHAGNNLDFQEYIVIPHTRNVSEATNLIVKLYRALRDKLIKEKGPETLCLGDEGGFAGEFKDTIEPFAFIERSATNAGLSDSFSYGIDVAASSTSLSTDKLLALYQRFSVEYPLTYIEDPFGEEDFKDFALLKKKIGNIVTIAGDDLTVTNTERMSLAREHDAVNGVIIKPNQIGTLTETVEAVKLAREYGWKVIVSHRSGTTSDAFIADIAYAFGADGFKLGAPARGERVAKYNRLLEIEEEARSIEK
jgi:enolase